MTSVLLGSSRVDLGCPFVGFIGHAEKLFSNAVGKASKGTGYCLRLFTAYSKVNDIVVNGVIADKSTSSRELDQLWRKIERLNLCCQITALGSSCIDHALHTNAQQCAGGSGGCFDYGLGFDKHFLGIGRHTVNWSYVATYWVDNFAGYAKRQIPTTWTTPQSYFLRCQELALGFFYIKR